MPQDASNLTTAAASLGAPTPKLALALTDSLKSTVCPACGGGKAARQSLCRQCYMGLPPAVRTRLYLRVGEGYEQAMAYALGAAGVVDDLSDTDALIGALTPAPGR